MFQVNVVFRSRIPLVVVKDGPIHFSMNINEMCFPVRTQNSLVFGLHTHELLWKLLVAKTLAEFAVECLTVPSLAFV